MLILPEAGQHDNRIDFVMLSIAKHPGNIEIARPDEPFGRASSR